MSKGTLDTRVFVPPSNGINFEKLRKVMDEKKAKNSFYSTKTHLKELLNNTLETFTSVEQELVDDIYEETPNEPALCSGSLFR